MLLKKAIKLKINIAFSHVPVAFVKAFDIDTAYPPVSLVFMNR